LVSCMLGSWVEKSLLVRIWDLRIVAPEGRVQARFTPVLGLVPAWLGSPTHAIPERAQEMQGGQRVATSDSRTPVYIMFVQRRRSCWSTFHFGR
jgi:hypothetical protein